MNMDEKVEQHCARRRDSRISSRELSYNIRSRYRRLSKMKLKDFINEKRWKNK